MDQWAFWVGLLLAVFYFAEFSSSFLLLLKCKRRMRGVDTTLALSRKPALLCILLASLLRTVYFCIILTHSPPRPKFDVPSWLFIIQAIPAFLFVVVEIILFGILLEIGHFARHRGAESLRMQRLSSVMMSLVLAFTSVLCLLFLFIVFYSHNRKRRLEAEFAVYVYLGLLFFLLAVSISYVGVKFFLSLSHLRSRSYPRHYRRMMWKVSVVSAFAVVAFTCRAIIIQLQISIHMLSTTVLVYGCYYFFFEVLPLLSLLWLFSSHGSVASDTQGTPYRTLP